MALLILIELILVFIVNNVLFDATVYLMPREFWLYVLCPIKIHGFVTNISGDNMDQLKHVKHNFNLPNIMNMFLIRLGCCVFVTDAISMFLF